MLTYPFIRQYALAIPETRERALELTPEQPQPVGSIDPEVPTKDVQSQVVELLLPDELSFGAAVWFYTASGVPGCADAKEGLQNGTDEGWTVYIEQCSKCFLAGSMP